MYIIVGLGNPGKKYENTRHNMGFLAVDVLAQKYDIKINKIKFKSLVGEGNIAGQKVVLVKPQTYMNLSGEAVREIVDFYKLDPQNLIVIYDYNRLTCHQRLQSLHPLDQLVVIFGFIS